jgi:glycosyltransferase involved in cell wall biosynthesis
VSWVVRPIVRWMKVTVAIPTCNRSVMLAQTIESVLRQTFADFTLLISDNASEDDTADVVAAFGDSRIVYTRHPVNIGLDANFNGVIDLVETDALVLLPDDDLLYPEHLATVTEVLEAHPRVGVVHTACDLIDDQGNVLKRDLALVGGDAPLVIESTVQFYERSMSTWMVNWPTALFRTRALREAGGLRAEDRPVADAVLYFRIARDWDYAAVRRTLAAIRTHEGSDSASMGRNTETAMIMGGRFNRQLLAHRLAAVGQAQVPEATRDRWRALARADAIHHLAYDAGDGAGWRSSTATFFDLVRIDHRILFDHRTARFVIAQLGGRRLKRLVRA